MKKKNIPDDSSWEPRESDILWMTLMITMLNDGAVWAVPQNGSIYRVDKMNKCFILILAPGVPDDIYDKNKRILAKLGWTIRDETETQN